jgi:hypothetical protein
LEKAPFSFPKPLMLIHENNVTNEHLKSMGIWRVADIQAFDSSPSN